LDIYILQICKDTFSEEVVLNNSRYRRNSRKSISNPFFFSWILVNEYIYILHYTL